MNGILDLSLVAERRQRYRRRVMWAIVVITSITAIFIGMSLNSAQLRCLWFERQSHAAQQKAVNALDCQKNESDFRLALRIFQQSKRWKRSRLVGDHLARGISRFGQVLVDTQSIETRRNSIQLLLQLELQRLDTVLFRNSGELPEPQRLVFFSAESLISQMKSVTQVGPGNATVMTQASSATLREISPHISLLLELKMNAADMDSRTVSLLAEVVQRSSSLGITEPLGHSKTPRSNDWGRLIMGAYKAGQIGAEEYMRFCVQSGQRDSEAEWSFVKSTLVENRFRVRDSIKVELALICALGLRGHSRQIRRLLRTIDLGESEDLKLLRSLNLLVHRAPGAAKARLMQWLADLANGREVGVVSTEVLSRLRWAGMVIRVLLESGGEEVVRKLEELIPAIELGLDGCVYGGSGSPRGSGISAADVLLFRRRVFEAQVCRLVVAGVLGEAELFRCVPLGGDEFGEACLRYWLGRRCGLVWRDVVSAEGIVGGVAGAGEDVVRLLLKLRYCGRLRGRRLIAILRSIWICEAGGLGGVALVQYREILAADEDLARWERGILLGLLGRGVGVVFEERIRAVLR